MLVGHFAVGLATKKLSPQTSLGASFLACQWLDIVWAVLVLAGVERVSIDHHVTVVMPLKLEYVAWSHSLFMSIVWSLCAVGLFKLLRKSTKDALLIAAVVFSHWVLDVITHRPGMPLWFGESTRLGLGLWNSLTGTLVVEVGMFAVAIWLYARVTRPKDRKGSWGFWVMIVLLSLIYIASVFGPKPAEDTPAAAIAGPALAFWLFVWWAHWADKHRVVG